MGWDAKEVVLLQKLWTMGQSAEQIARQTMIFGRVIPRQEMIDKIDRLGLGAALRRDAPCTDPHDRPDPERARRVLTCPPRH